MIGFLLLGMHLSCDKNVTYGGAIDCKRRQYGRRN